MNKEQEQEFFNQIEEVLHAHEDTYETGAWEEFDAHRKKKKRNMPIFVWAAAAAVLLIAGYVLFGLNNTNQIQKNPSLVKNEKPDVYVPLDTPVTTNVVEMVVNSLVTAVVNRPIAGLVLADTVPTVNIAPNPQVESANLVVKNDVITDKNIAIEKAIVLNGVKPLRENAGAYDSLLNKNNAPVVFEKQERKFTYAVAVSPSLGNQKLNFGAGMELSYAITNRLSISSGLMYTALNAQSDGQSLAATSSLNGQSANLSLTGIELPLGIQYQTKSGYYAAAGVSALGLINDKLEYSYLKENTITLTQSSPGGTSEVLKVVSERKSKESFEPIDNYMGFFNFSAGKKQAFGKTNLNIGPFVKIPFSSVSSERIKLLQGGVMVSIDF